uniref:Amidohydrolase n=1 Tax=candidate division WOR-3 bacterium TaxID=2052148 RepID=A0A7C4UCI7_UNCW3
MVERIINEYKDEVIRLRRELHRIPELAFEEFKTSEFIKKYIHSLGLKPINCNKTGLYFDIGVNPEIALRADMDGLPINEETGLQFSSIHPNKMHACGHDAHMAMLLVVSKIIIEKKLPYSVRCIFQPSEERIPGGAPGMIKEGVLNGIKRIFGLHIEPSLKTGEIITKKGAFMAASDEMDIWIKGKGGHASTPEKTQDSIYLASLFITSLQSIVSRRKDANTPLVITISSIKAGSVYNIIPEEVYMMGTVRNIDENLLEKSPFMIEKILDGITSTFDADYYLNYRRGYPVLNNDNDSVDVLKEICKGKFDFKEIPNPIMGGEDFAYYLKNVKGCFAFLGAGGKEGKMSELHTENMNFDEDAMMNGVYIFLKLCERYGRKD